jgi:2-polyprenyl-3-methyl-5-hydroxy-6-metoxy-1,4-benzoquinol methylase
MSIDKERWSTAQEREAAYWGNCNSHVAYGEFLKQEVYGREMGVFAEYGTPELELDMRGKSVLDIGGGPVSMTLRAFNAGQLVVVDPCKWPDCVLRRYDRHGINFLRCSGEELDEKFLSDETTFDEVWMYNVLQHVHNPELIVHNAVKRINPVGGVLRVYEWVWIPADVNCHPHTLTPEGMLNWLHGCRIVKVGLPRIVEHGCDATAFTGLFERP